MTSATLFDLETAMVTNADNVEFFQSHISHGRVVDASRVTTQGEQVRSLRFFVACIPPTANHQRKRIVRVGKWTRLADTPELNAAKDMLDSLLLPHQPAQPIAGPVALSIHWQWPWRASESKKRRALGQVPHTSRPDLSNLAKTLEDRLVALRFLEDDNAVVDLRLTKAWGDRPGIAVALRPVGREG